MQSKLSICTFLSSHLDVSTLTQHLGTDHYALMHCSSDEEFLDYINHQRQQVDCLIVEQSVQVDALLRQLKHRAMLLPAVIVDPDTGRDAVASSREDMGPATYHQAVLTLSANQFEQIGHIIDRAINQFLQLSPSCSLSENEAATSTNLQSSIQASLSFQQGRLADKLKERLGYLGVYYKRSPANFLRHMTQQQRRKFIQQLKQDYREIVLLYFSDETTLNEKIDNFVNIAFFADVSVAQIVEIHMELMDEFSKQLKLEGRSEEILLDYRLTLIDTIAHLCEMYRRSIPRDA